MDVIYRLSQLLPKPSIDQKAPRLCDAVPPSVPNTKGRKVTTNVAFLPDHLVIKTPTVSHKSDNCYLFLKLGDYTS